jgi:putative flippase GtrA
MRSRSELFIRFALVGVVGFLVDAGVVAILVRLLGVGPYPARACSYLFAVTTTWSLNRQFTFESSSPPFREFLAFLLTNGLGATINLLVYAVLIAWRGSAGLMPVIGVAVGSLAGLLVNFVFSSKLVFSKRGAAPLNAPVRGNPDT